MTYAVTRWDEGRYLCGGTTGDGWGYEHDYRHGVSRAWRVLPNGQPDPAFSDELESEGEGHEHAIFDKIAAELIADEDRIEPVEMRKAG